VVGSAGKTGYLYNMKNNGARIILLKVALSAALIQAEYGFDRQHVKVVV